MIPTIEQFVSGVVNDYIVRPTGSPNLVGVGGFVFDILDNEELHLDAEVTDHYVEDNYAIQDHIAIRPVSFTLRGYMAELRDLQSQSLLPTLTKIQSLASIGGFMPKFASQATQVYTKISDVTSKVNSVVNQANNLLDIFNLKSTTSTNQQKAFSFFQQALQNRQLCTVETPFNIFENMAVVSVRALQRGDTTIVSDFTVTFKQIRTTSTTTDVPVQVLSGRAATAVSKSVASGLVTGSPITDSLSTLKTKYPVFA